MPRRCGVPAPRTSRSAAWETPGTSRTPCSSSRPTWPATSPASSWSSTVGSHSGACNAILIEVMALTIGDTAPDFEAETTEGRIAFHEWLGDSWAVLFSHPKDFTPICTTELGYMASIKPEFDRRGVKIIGLSVDATEDHAQWARDIEETQGTAPNYPIIGDNDFKVATLYGMLPAGTSGD